MTEAMDLLSDLIGDSPALRAVRERIARLLAHASDVRRLPPVLIQGETGTGKGLVARALHRAGPRAQGPFVDVNCAAIPETLLEAEMFGYERGAFTDARQAKRGLFQMAHRGTLFLDEIGLLPASLQAKLLTVLEERTVRRLGATQNEPVDIWIVAATNADLQVSTRTGKFREDLYHRLAVLTLVLPPLRERGSDILTLAEHFLARASEDYGLRPKTLASDARAALLAYGWPGNVRELTNVIERVSLLTETPTVTAAALGLMVRDPVPSSPRTEGGPPDAQPLLVEAAESVERDQLLEVLREAGGNVSRAAARLGISRNTLRYRIEKHGLRPGSVPPPRRRTRSPGAPKPEAPSPTAPGPSSPAVIRWQRRRLTLVRATLDMPSEGPLLVEGSRLLEVFVDKIRMFGGRLEELSPSSVLALFGLEAVEDAPKRAALTAIAILNAKQRATGSPSAAVAVRVGIHSSQFTLGVIGETVVIEPGARQEAWNVVTQLVDLSAPDCTLASPETMRLLQRDFALQPFTVPEGRLTRAYRLEGLLSMRPGAAVHASRFVGREKDLALLRDRLEATMRGQGQVAGISGEAGIGKSRLLFEFRDDLLGRGVTYMGGQCVSHGSTITYLPILALLREHFGIVEAEEPATISAKVRAILETLGMPFHESAPYLLRLLGLKEGTEPLAMLDPNGIRVRTFELLGEMLVRISRQAPLVIAVEDLHWIDKTSEEFLTSLVDALASSRILLIATYRPGYRPPWMDRSSATQIGLQPLALHDGEIVVRSTLGEGLAEPVLEAILAKGEGNPFFLEELARAAREQGGLSLTVPDTIEGVLLARIDRLSAPDKELLESAAVIGKDFTLALLRAITGQLDDALGERLRSLRAAEFIQETTFGIDPEYTFRHALIQDVAYGILPPGERHILHTRLVETIERLHASRLEEQTERLAHHAFLAETWEKALTYLRRAGERAFARASHREAVAYFERALTALRHLPESRERIQQGIDVRFDLRTALLPLGELRRGLEYLREANGLAESLEDPHRAGWLAVYMTGQFYLLGDQVSAFDMGQQALAIAERLHDFSLDVSTNAYVGQVYHVRGDYRRAATLFRRNVEALVGDRVRERFGLPQPPSVHSRTCLVWCLAELGEFAEGIVRGEEALRIAEAVDQPLSLTVAYSGLGSLYVRKGDLEKAIPLLERGLELGRAWNIPLWFPPVASALGSAYAFSGRFPDALVLLQQAVERAASMNLIRGHSHLLAALGEAYLLAGELDRAVEIAQRALVLARNHQERGNEGWIYRLLGEAAAHAARGLDEGRARCHDALVIATDLGMRPLAARSHHTLARIHAQAGDERAAGEARAASARLADEMDLRLAMFPGRDSVP